MSLSADAKTNLARFFDRLAYDGRDTSNDDLSAAMKRSVCMPDIIKAGAVIATSTDAANDSTAFFAAMTDAQYAALVTRAAAGFARMTSLEWTTFAALVDAETTRRG